MEARSSLFPDWPWLCTVINPTFHRRSLSKGLKQRALHVHHTKTKHFITKVFAQPIDSVIFSICMLTLQKQNERSNGFDEQSQLRLPHLYSKADRVRSRCQQVGLPRPDTPHDRSKVCAIAALKSSTIQTRFLLSTLFKIYIFWVTASPFLP